MKKIERNHVEKIWIMNWIAIKDKLSKTKPSKTRDEKKPEKTKKMTGQNTTVVCEKVKTNNNFNFILE